MQERYVIETDHARVVVETRRGAKLSSLLHKQTAREWLLQAHGADHRVPGYGSIFTDAPLSGWDEMLPSVDACVYPADPYRGVEIPDHGEVWAVPWQVEDVSPTSVTCSVRGRALPYRLTRSLELAGPDLTASYELCVIGDNELSLLWAPHPQYAMRAGTVLTFPIGVEHLTAVTEGRPGSARQQRIPAEGLDCAQLVPRGGGLTLYTIPGMTTDRAELRDRDGCWLRMVWNSEELPYLAVWMDNGSYAASAPVVCLEPMTGYYDDLSRAYRQGRVLVVEPGQPARWSVHVALGTY